MKHSRHRSPLKIISAAVIGAALTGCTSFAPTVYKTEVIKCPPRQPVMTCVLDLPVDVGDTDALAAYVRALTPREGSQRTAEALRGWAQCAAEVKPWRAGYAVCVAADAKERPRG